MRFNVGFFFIIFTLFMKNLFGMEDDSVVLGPRFLQNRQNRVHRTSIQLPIDLNQLGRYFSNILSRLEIRSISVEPKANRKDTIYISNNRNYDEVREWLNKKYPEKIRLLKNSKKFNWNDINKNLSHLLIEERSRLEKTKYNAFFKCNGINKRQEVCRFYEKMNQYYDLCKRERRAGERSLIRPCEKLWSVDNSRSDEYKENIRNKLWLIVICDDQFEKEFSVNVVPSVFIFSQDFCNKLNIWVEKTVKNEKRVLKFIPQSVWEEREWWIVENFNILKKILSKHFDFELKCNLVDIIIGKKNI